MLRAAQYSEANFRKIAITDMHIASSHPAREPRTLYLNPPYFNLNFKPPEFCAAHNI